MMNAALKVFAMNGYRRASTDDIVAEAAISKGLLFHYFESKIGLYSFIYDYSVRYMTLELTTLVGSRETDLFQIVRMVELARLQVLRNYPYMQQFLNRAMQEDVSEALLAIEEKKNAYTDTVDKLYEQADMTRFGKGTDGLMVRKIIDFTIQGLMSEHLLEGSYNPEMLYEEIGNYLDLLKKAMYQDE